MDPLKYDETGEDEYSDQPSLFARVLWWMVWVLAAILLLAFVTMASVAMLAPDALSGACVRTQLVRPEDCSPGVGDANR